MNDIDRKLRAYEAAWDETDPVKRLELLEIAWADTGRYTDPTADVTGRGALGALIGQLHETYPGARITLTSKADAHHDVFHFTWSLISAEGNTMTQGRDFGRIDEDGRIARIVGFFGEPDPL